jgi:hypothetical protein
MSGDRSTLLHAKAGEGGATGSGKGDSRGDARP